MQQYSRIVGRVSILEVDPFMQAVMNKAPANERIAAIGLLQGGSRGSQARLIVREDPVPYRQIFE
ncbi:hypothetical protein GN958_ATG00833 [Phytophthora infestans]|uniref:Uncharacterized protein n=1 Tax=Phytophthora infestans TaxID=4787 RepID=A0A8S9VEK3_PHYIN|nr:hypothetical protein GN958_ATG00833 [Phytophthora infestans]